MYLSGKISYFQTDTTRIYVWKLEKKNSENFQFVLLCRPGIRLTGKRTVLFLCCNIIIFRFSRYSNDILFTMIFSAFTIGRRQLPESAKFTGTRVDVNGFPKSFHSPTLRYVYVFPSSKGDFSTNHSCVCGGGAAA